MALRTTTLANVAAPWLRRIGVCLSLLLAGSCVGPDLEPPGGANATAPSSNGAPTTTPQGTGGSSASAPNGSSQPVLTPSTSAAGQPAVAGMNPGGQVPPANPPTTTSAPAPSAGSAAPAKDAEDAGVTDAGTDAGNLPRR